MEWGGRGLLVIFLSGATASVALGDSITGISSTTADPASRVAIQADDKTALPSQEDLAVVVLQGGASSRAVREQALRALPWKQLSAEQQQTANLVLSDISLFRRLPTVRCPINSQTYQYFLERPDAAASIWRVLGISRLELKQTQGETFVADTGDGSSGTVQILLRSPTQCVVYCDGLFKSPLLAKPIKARALVGLNASFQSQRDGTMVVTHTVDMFVTFPSLAVETIAKLVSPLSYKYADRNMEEITSFLRMMDLAMERQPGWIEQIAKSMEGISEECRQALLKSTAEVYVESQRRASIARGDAAAAGTAPPVRTASGPGVAIPR